MRAVSILLFLVAALHITLAVGCAEQPGDFCVADGKIELAGGNVANLAGHYIEARLVGNPSVRASGEIEADGRFELDTIHRGNVVPGAPAGKYRLRLILSDDDPELRRQAAAMVDPRQLQFETSGLVLEVPARDPVIHIRQRL